MTVLTLDPPHRQTCPIWEGLRRDTIHYGHSVVDGGSRFYSSRAGGSESELRFSTHSQEGEHDRQFELGKQRGDHKQRHDCSCRHCHHYSYQDFHLGLVGHIARSKGGTEHLAAALPLLQPHQGRPRHGVPARQAATLNGNTSSEQPKFQGSSGTPWTSDQALEAALRALNFERTREKGVQMRQT